MTCDKALIDQLIHYQGWPWVPYLCKDSVLYRIIHMMDQMCMKYLPMIVDASTFMSFQ